LHPSACLDGSVSDCNRSLGGHEQARSPVDLHAAAAPGSANWKKPNEINRWHLSANPVSATVNPPLWSWWRNPLFCWVWCMARQHLRHLPPQSAAALPVPQRSMIST
jgi:hypothetical protein